MLQIRNLQCRGQSGQPGVTSMASWGWPGAWTAGRQSARGAWRVGAADKDNSLQSHIDCYHYWLMNIWIWIIDYDFNLAFFLQMNSNVHHHYVQHRHTLFISTAGEDWRRNPGTIALTVQHKAYLGSRWIKNFPVDPTQKNSTYLPSTAGRKIGAGSSWGEVLLAILCS